MEKFKKSGVNLNTAIKLCGNITESLTSFFTTMYHLKFSPHLIKEKLQFDKDELVNKYKLAIGNISKKDK